MALRRLGEFTLNEDQARTWLVDTWEIEPGWNPALNPEEEGSAVCDLVRDAQRCGVITAPAGAEVCFTWSDDGEHGMNYRPVVILSYGDHQELRLCTVVRPMSDLADPDAGSVDAALEVLSHLAAEGNHMLRSLKAFVAAQS